jgi:hypothetical protein
MRIAATNLLIMSEIQRANQALLPHPATLFLFVVIPNGRSMM